MEQRIVAVSGVKNSGKTTLLEHIIPILKNRGISAAVIKHDGHEFEPDVPGTDTRRCLESGASGCAIFSGQRFMVVKEEPGMDEVRLMKAFPEADLILLEGFKNSSYPKLEVVRKANSDFCVCAPETLLAVVSDMDAAPEGVRLIGLNQYEEVAELLYRLCRCGG